MEGNRCQVVERCVKIVSYMSWRGIKSVVSIVCACERLERKGGGMREGGTCRERTRNGGSQLHSEQTFKIDSSVKQTDWFHLHKVLQIT